MSSTILQCLNVKKIFHKNSGDVEVLKNVNLSIEKGETIFIFGKSGQGKSVLMSLLCGLDVPSSGEIFFEGVNLNSCSMTKLAELRRTEIGIIFQNLNLIASWTALENVEAALDGIVKSANARRKYAGELLESIGLTSRFNHLPSEMSMGEQQRVAIARTLIREPKLILADEPCGDLDDDSGKDIVNLLNQYVQDYNAALLITSHGHFPSNNPDKSFVLQNGTLTEASKVNLKEANAVLMPV